MYSDETNENSVRNEAEDLFMKEFKYFRQIKQLNDFTHILSAENVTSFPDLKVSFNFCLNYFFFKDVNTILLLRLYN